LQKTADKQFKVKLVMFDLDGTLIDTAPQIAEAMNLALTDLGLNKLPISRITDYIGAGVDALIKRCLTDNLHDESDATLLEQAQAAFFCTLCQQCHKKFAIPWRHFWPASG